MRPVALFRWCDQKMLFARDRLRAIFNLIYLNKKSSGRVADGFYIEGSDGFG